MPAKNRGDGAVQASRTVYVNQCTWEYWGGLRKSIGHVNLLRINDASCPQHLKTKGRLSTTVK